MAATVEHFPLESKVFTRRTKEGAVKTTTLLQFKNEGATDKSSQPVVPQSAVASLPSPDHCLIVGFTIENERHVVQVC